jgi:hypothetical protein
MNNIFEHFNNEKDRLLKEGNLLKYHFFDITKEEWETMEDEIHFRASSNIVPKGVKKTLGIDRVIQINGLTFLIRFKDKIVS